MLKNKTIITISVMAGLLAVVTTRGDDFEISWYTVDGGGEMQSSGGGFVLSGTIGQADASATLTGGDLRLTGGFWAVAVPKCGCLSDINKDDLRDGLDVQGFVECFVATGSNCACADVDGVPGLDMNDVSVFVDDLIIGLACQ